MGFVGWRICQRVFAVLVLVLSGSCSFAEPDFSEGAVVFNQKFDDPLDLRSLRFAVSDAEFDKVWQEVGRGQPMPEVDFRTSAAIVVESFHGPACDYWPRGVVVSDPDVTSFRVIQLHFGHSKDEVPADCGRPYSGASAHVMVFTVQLAAVDSEEWLVATSGMAPNESIMFP